MEWNTRDLRQLSRSNCHLCRGVGYKETLSGDVEPCECALAGIFRACYAHFRHCVEHRQAVSKVSFDPAPSGRSNRGMWGLKREEYIADFEIVARRTLAGNAYKLFRFRHLLGASPEMCARRMRWSPQQTKRQIERIERVLARTFATLKPYGLYPLYDYFHGRRSVPVGSSLRTADGGEAFWRPPVRNRQLVA